MHRNSESGRGVLRKLGIDLEYPWAVRGKLGGHGFDLDVPDENAYLIAELYLTTRGLRTSRSSVDYRT